MKAIYKIALVILLNFNVPTYAHQGGLFVSEAIQCHIATPTLVSEKLWFAVTSPVNSGYEMPLNSAMAPYQIQDSAGTMTFHFNQLVYRITELKQTVVIKKNKAEEVQISVYDNNGTLIATANEDFAKNKTGMTEINKGQENWRLPHITCYHERAGFSARNLKNSFRLPPPY